MTSKTEATTILLRRLEHLEARIAERERTGVNTSYDRAERAAIRVALRELADDALRYGPPTP